MFVNLPHRFSVVHNERWKWLGFVHQPNQLKNSTHGGICVFLLLKSTKINNGILCNILLFRNIFLTFNLIYLAPIRDNSSKRKWFRFLTFKINSSLVHKVSQNKKTLGWAIHWYSVLQVTSPSVCLINYERLSFKSRPFSSQTKQRAAARRSQAPQRQSVWFQTTWDTSLWINIKQCMPYRPCLHRTQEVD